MADLHRLSAWRLTPDVDDWIVDLSPEISSSQGSTALNQRFSIDPMQEESLPIGKSLARDCEESCSECFRRPALSCAFLCQPSADLEGNSSELRTEKLFSSAQTSQPPAFLSLSSANHSSSSLRTAADTELQARKKTGRKPGTIFCTFCGAVLPYKIALIAHLRKKHGIRRSLSLMYKRIREGAGDLVRRYGEEMPKF